MNSFDRIKKYFTSSEIEAIDRIVTELRSRWPDAKLKLFGSKVTGKFDKESDIDVLIILPCEVDEKIREEIIDMIFDINLKFDTNISPLIFSEREWADLSILPIHYFIEKEGSSFFLCQQNLSRMFLYCQCSITSKNLKFKKHSGVRASFHKNFVKQGLVSPDDGRFYDRLFEARQRGDYVEFVHFEKEQVERWLNKAREFVNKMKRLIEKFTEEGKSPRA